MRTLRFLTLFLAVTFTFPVWAYPPVEEVTMPSGITAWLMRVPNLPIMNVSFVFTGGGTAFDPADKQGMAALVSDMLMEGTSQVDVKRFHSELDRYGISLSARPDTKYFTMHIKTLTPERERAFSLASSMLREPLLTEDALSKVKERMKANRIAQQEEAGYIAEKLWRTTAYPNHPYKQDALGTDASVAGMTAEDIRHFLTERLTRDRLVVVAAGDIDAESLGELIERHFGFLPATTQAKNTLPVEIPTIAGIYHQTMPTSQSVVVFGLPGYDRHHPDFYALYVLNEILGGAGFMSLLTEELREKRGLVYGVSTGLDADEYSPLIQGYFSTRANQVDEAISLTRELFTKTASSITAKEVEDAKANIIGSLPVNTDTTSKLASFLRTMRLENLGKDYLEKRSDYFRAVTLADVQRVAKDVLSADKLLFTVAGQPPAEK